MAKTPVTTTAPTGQIAPFGLRMLPELREKIEAAAKASGRSMNAEVVARLEKSLARDEDWSEFSQAERLKEGFALRGQIQLLVQRGAVLGYGTLMLHELMTKGSWGHATPDQVKSEVDRALEDANNAIAEAQRALPDKLISDLQAAMARSDELALKMFNSRSLPDPGQPDPSPKVEATTSKLGRSEVPAPNRGSRKVPRKKR